MGEIVDKYCSTEIKRLIAKAVAAFAGFRNI